MTPGGNDVEKTDVAFSKVLWTLAEFGQGFGESELSGVAAVCELEIEFSDGISIGLKSPGIPLDPFNPGRTADGEPEGKTGAVK